MTLSRAMEIGAKIADELSPFCSRLQIAGSIRRQRLEIGDIDIVCLPSDSAGLRARVLKTHPRILANGQHNLQVELKGGVRLDVWMAQLGQRTLFGEGGTNWGSLLLCRTGSISHNIHLVETARLLGLRWNPYWGVYDGMGRCIACETEEEIFAALKLDFIKPEDREK